MTIKDFKKLKKGDLVKCINGASSDAYKLGEIYEVRETLIENYGYRPPRKFCHRIVTMVDSKGSTDNHWGCENFKIGKCFTQDFEKILK